MYYDSVKRHLIEEYGNRLGTFLVNRLSGMIRKRKAECLSHFRLCEKGNIIQEQEYEKTRKAGCCGFADEEFIFKSDNEDNRIFRIGFNYGH